jgi:hypothetical protein
MKRTCISGLVTTVALLGAGATSATAAINVAVGNHVVALGSSITTTIGVSNSDMPAASGIEGVVLTFQIDTGAGSTPSVSSIDLLTNTIWAGHVSAPFISTPAGGNLPQYQSRDLFTDTPGDVVDANGTLARVTLNTAGAPVGTYALKLTGTKTAGRDSAFLNAVGEAVAATFTNGTLTIADNGDATLDGKVNAFDLNALAANWQKPANATWSEGDFNNDGVVNAFDLNALASNWQFGAGGSVAAQSFDAALAQAFGGAVPVPEPTSLSLLGLALPLLARRSRKP